MLCVGECSCLCWVKPKSLIQLLLNVYIFASSLYLVLQMFLGYFVFFKKSNFTCRRDGNETHKKRKKDGVVCDQSSAFW